MKYHLITLGCQMNISDSERIKKVIETRMGYEWTDHEEEASLLGMVACSVRQKAIDKVYNKIHTWNRRKDRKNLITILSGCVLPADKEKFLKLFDIVFDISELNQLPEMISHYGVNTPLGVLSRESELFNSIHEFWHITPNYNSTFEAFVPIQNGCDKFCTFCAVPYTRGREVSRPSEEILEEVRSLMLRGYKSVTLLGQNVNSYGLDKKSQEIHFPELLERIGQIGDETGAGCWVYFTSPHPRDMTDEVIDVIARYRVLASQIHLPVQSGDEKMLIRMNRKHSLEKYMQIIQKIRRTLPEATIFTDIIVGFTGETDEQFENSRLLMEQVKFNMAYIAKYSQRPGAASSRWADDVPHEIKKERLEILSLELRKHTRIYNKGLIGKKLRILVTGKDRKPGYFTGYTEGRIIARFQSDNENLTGRFVDLEIISAAELSIEGKLIPSTENLLTDEANHFIQNIGLPA